jgi:hypothetical protein
MKDLRTFFLSQSHDQRNDPPDPPKDATPLAPIHLDQSFLTDLGCAVWKLRQKIFDPETKEPKAEVRHLARHVMVIWDRLAEVGLEIQDHTGNPFDSGQSLEVLAFQPTKEVLQETVIETVRPTIYIAGRQILKGQVIVGSPETPSANGDQI